MKLEEIGFYTLSDFRFKNSSGNSPIYRGELIVGGRCNFACPYCRGLKVDGKSVTYNFPIEQLMYTLELWVKEGLKNVRFSGGEPTLHPSLLDLVKYCKTNNVERIAISTNGSADLNLYQQLIDAGINDFSISLDSCCSSFGDKMAGVDGQWEKVVSNIRELSKLTYVTVGVVLTEDNVHLLTDIIQFADSLGVSDIRIISAAQYNKLLESAKSIPANLLSKYPILRYRVNNIKNGINVRGLDENDTSYCALVHDDMIVVGEYHYPCVIYMREGGNPIGKVGVNMRKERMEWALTHNVLEDNICRNQCLDVCSSCNRKYQILHN
jgi:MoaA/NifB/PqqE/SkfB family radical SAM enzyme